MNKNFEKFKPNILVIGDLMIDNYLWGDSNRISPEAPVQIVDIKKESQILGGAGNVVNNLQSLNADVSVMSIIGNCRISEELKSLFKKNHISTEFLFSEKERITSKKTRLVSARQQVVRFDIDCNKDIKSSSEKKLLDAFQSVVQLYDAIILSDYGKGVLTNSLTRNIIRSAGKLNIPVLVDPKGSDYSKYSGAYLLTPNRKEASEATNIDLVDDASVDLALKKLKEDFSLRYSLITLSEDGIVLYDNKKQHFPTLAQEVYDVTGAGDTVIASLGFAISCKLNISEAVKFANTAAGIVVGKIGSATVSLEEVIKFKYNNVTSKNSSKDCIKSFDDILDICKEAKSQNKRIVFTNGCFDILHSGHVQYLEKSKEFGDILIVGINSDSSVRTLKGSSRPINNQDDRAGIIGSLKPVDYVVIFNEETPLKLIEIIKPNILVKGGDYKNQSIVGSEIADEVKIVDFLSGKSTTNIIEKIIGK